MRSTIKNSELMRKRKDRMARMALKIKRDKEIDPEKDYRIMIPKIQLQKN
jgi:hypothetical protein